MTEHCASVGGTALFSSTPQGGCLGTTICRASPRWLCVLVINFNVLEHKTTPLPLTRLKNKRAMLIIIIFCRVPTRLDHGNSWLLKVLPDHFLFPVQQFPRKATRCPAVKMERPVLLYALWGRRGSDKGGRKEIKHPWKGGGATPLLNVPTSPVHHGERQENDLMEGTVTGRITDAVGKSKRGFGKPQSVHRLLFPFSVFPFFFVSLHGRDTEGPRGRCRKLPFLFFCVLS